MPELSRFLGIVIFMNYRDHSPPHFHVKYNEFRASLSIQELKVLNGKLPRRVLVMVLEWAFKYRKELLDNWKRACKKEPLKPILPLT